MKGSGSPKSPLEGGQLAGGSGGAESARDPQESPAFLGRRPRWFPCSPCACPKSTQSRRAVVETCQDTLQPRTRSQARVIEMIESN